MCRPGRRCTASVNHVRRAVLPLAAAAGMSNRRYDELHDRARQNLAATGTRDPDYYRGTVDQAAAAEFLHSARADLDAQHVTGPGVTQARKQLDAAAAAISSGTVTRAMFDSAYRAPWHVARTALEQLPSQAEIPAATALPRPERASPPEGSERIPVPAGQLRAGDWVRGRVVHSVTHDWLGRDRAGTVQIRWADGTSSTWDARTSIGTHRTLMGAGAPTA